MSEAAATVDRAVFEALLMSFDTAVRALADAGESDLACRIAARAWSDTHRDSRRADRRLTATLHYLVLPQASTRSGVAGRADHHDTHPEGAP